MNYIFVPGNQINGKRDTEREREREQERERKKFGKTIFNLFFKFLLFIHFSCGLVTYHHTKFKLTFKSQKSQNKQIRCGA